MSVIANLEVVSKVDAVLQVQIAIRIATAEDFKDNSGEAPVRKIGQTYWLQDGDGAIPNRPNILTKDTDLHEIKYFLGLTRVYVPVMFNDEKNN